MPATHSLAPHALAKAQAQFDTEAAGARVRRLRRRARRPAQVFTFDALIRAYCVGITAVTFAFSFGWLP